MQRQPSREDYYNPHTRQQIAEDHIGYNPIAATPDIDSPVSPPQRSRVSFAPLRSPAQDGLAPDTPSSVGLGIGSIDHGSQFPSYYPVVSRDSFQQDSDSRPITPSVQQANNWSKSTIAPREYPLDAPNGTPYYYPSPYGGLSPPGGPGNYPSARLADSNAWKMVQGGWTMYSLFLLGFACAVGHHVFYDSLDGKPADDQIRMMRFGGLLSYAAKASLVAAVVFAYRQQIWVTVINKVLRLRTIDSLFAAVDEPLALWNWEFVRKAYFAAGLAVLAWLFPLTVILTPATLTVAPLTEVREDRCHGVRTLNFDLEKDKDWRRVDRINGYRGISLSLVNSTVQQSMGLVDTPFNDTFFDYWTGSSAQVELVSSQSALTGTVIPRRDVALEACGAGWDCSYDVSFMAPGYKCSELARGQKLDWDGLRRQGVPFDAGELAPHGNLSYIAETNVGEYFNEQVEVIAGGAPVMKPPYPKHLGAFRTEPVLWVGYSALVRPGRPPENRDAPGWDTDLESVVFRCEHYVTNYTVRFNHTFSEQITAVLSRDYVHPVINTTFVPGKNANDGTKDNTTAVPTSNYVLPVDFETYRVTAAYHSLGKRMRSFINGLIRFSPYVQIETQASSTSLIDFETYLPSANLMADMQRFYENITLSLLSNPQFVVVAWAARPDQRSGIANDNVTADPALSYPCTKTRVANAYVYNRRDLWVAYAAAISVALFAVVLGSAALSQNNFHVRDVHVSSIVAATRAPCLEDLPWKASKWGEVPREILETRLGYGVVSESGPNGTPAAVASGGVVSGMWMTGVGSPPAVVGGKVYYGFAPREVLERTRVATLGQGKKRNRMSAFSFRTWEQTHG
ncbi:Formylmethionine deformylase-like protein [Parathielavia hyrcaniae]|uniref:Formylmethionine deformylase-like protein n=1 Tax=Parathielavia hyrcaniae TaxID=113614 RepID=A0AAN6T0T7_9PEZI|nr:Formylmethionine deformylase-like protein [Parathielavia hyrcaniae]